MRRLMVWLLILLLPLAAAAEGLFVVGTPHKSHLDYRQYFETMSAQAGECTLAFAQSAYEEGLAQQVYAQVAADETVLSALAPARPHTVYVVDKPLAGMQRIDSAIYCTAAQVLDGSYRPWLAEAAFGTERWQSVGLAGYAFGAAVDEAALQAWYAGDLHDDMLSLFPAYFVEAFATPEERHMAEQTAIALFGYIAEQHGLDTALTADASAHVQGWLASIGVERAYADPFAGLLDGYTWGHNQFYALIGTSPKGDVFKLNPLSYDMTTAADVRLALCDLELGVDAILAGVKRDAPDWYDRLAKNLEAPITYEFKENNGYSVTYYANRRIDVGGAHTLIHETAHMMTPCQTGRISRYMDQWKVEAIAEYLTRAYYESMMEKHVLMSFAQEAAEAESQSYQAFSAQLLNGVYMNLFDSLELKSFWRLSVLTAEEDLNPVSSVYAGAGSASLDAVNGNELSYAGAEWLASYLINRHGLSTFLHYCMDEGVSFEEAFGVPYEEAKADWLANRSLLD